MLVEKRPPDNRLYMSPPWVGNDEAEAVRAAIGSGWVAPLGPEVDAFEVSLAEACGRQTAIALSSGTAALHMGLLALGVKPGDEVATSTLTFAATAFAINYVGAKPVFLDVEEESWNIDARLLESFLAARASARKLPAAVVPVDVFGRTCDYERVLPVCSAYGVPVLCDSAEALGALHGGNPAGSYGAAAVFSFNGNKIITTSGGGALVTDDPQIASKVRKWSNQSRELVPWYEHEDIGFNYRMSNVLAALGRAQLTRLSQIVSRRRGIRDRYAAALETFPGLSVPGDPPWGQWNGWLTTVRFNSDQYPDAATRVREALNSVDVEARPIWKPMHQQPVFSGAEAVLTGTADRLFSEGLCLPSGTGMTDDDVDRVLEVVADVVSA